MLPAIACTASTPTVRLLLLLLLLLQLQHWWPSKAMCRRLAMLDWAGWVGGLGAAQAEGGQDLRGRGLLTCCCWGVLRLWRW